MDTKIKILILSLFTAFNLFGQSPLSLAVRYNITSATGGDPYTVVGVVSDDLSRFTGSDIAIGDSLYVIDGSDLYVLKITAINSVVGPTVNLTADDPSNAGISLPTGQSAIVRPTPNYKLPIYISGLRDDLRSMMMNRQAKIIDQITGGGVASITDFISAGQGVPPSALASSNGGETWRNMTTGELWRSDGGRWHPFVYDGKECQDTVLVSAITVQSGGSVTTGSPLVKSSGGVWQHMYNHPSGTNLIPDGVIVDIIGTPAKALINYCGVRKGSGATPNTSYYVDQTVSTGFTTTKPSTNIRPLGKVASNGDFIINAGLLFSRDNNINIDSTFAKTNGSYVNKRITDNVYKNGTLGIRTTDTTGVFNLNVPSDASDKIRLSFWGNGSYITYSPKNTASTNPVINSFYTGKSFSANAGFAGENMVYNGGINYSPGGGHVSRYANAVGWGLENNFKNSGTEKGEPGFGFYEMQWPEVVYSDTVQGSDGVKRATGVANNTKRRMIAGYASNQRPSYGGYFSVASDQMPITDWKTGQPKAVWTFAENMPNNKGITFIDTASLIFQKNNAGGLYYLNAAGNATLGCFKVDNLNRIVLGFSGISNLFTEAQVFNSIGPLTISPLANQQLNLGSISSASEVNINAVSSVPLIIKSSVATNGLGFNVNNFDVSMRDMGTNNDVVRFDRGSPSFSIWIRNNGNIGIGAYPDSDVAFHIKKTSLPATSKLISIENSTGKSGGYRSNAPPEGAITANPGDFVLTNISGIGGFSIKKSGTGNTGWEQVVTTTGTSTSISTMMREESFTATASQTAFTIAYSAPAVSGTSVPIRVYRNGVRLFYVASGPTITQFTYSGTIVTTAANTAGDIITIEYLN